MRSWPIDRPFPPPLSGLRRSTDLPHISDLIHDFLYDLSGGKDTYPDMTDEERRMIFERGFVWEDLLSHAYAGRVGVRPPEIVVDGVAMSPDGVRGEEIEALMQTFQDTGLWQISKEDWDDVTDGMERVGAEYKSTKLGLALHKGEIEIRRKFENNQNWMMQAKCYAKGIGSLKGEFHILYVNGNYGHGAKDIATRNYVYDIRGYEFTQLEVDQQWKAIINHAKRKGTLT